MTAKEKKTLSDIGDLSNLLKPKKQEVEEKSDGKPLQLPIEKLHADPDNRIDISEAFLEKLTIDIKERGVKDPISVRNHPDPAMAADGHYMINDGHQRVTSSLMAGKVFVPGFVDNDYDDFDQQKANLLREEQSALDNARFIKRNLNKGVSKGEIAKRLGFSPAWVSQHVALLSLPEALNGIFGPGNRCDDVTVMNELLRLYKKHPDEVTVWLEDDTQEITRSTIKLLSEFIESKGQDEGADDIGGDDAGANDEPKQDKEKKEKESDPTKLKKAIVIIEYMGQSGQLDLKKRPSMTDNGWIKLDSDGEEVEVPLAQLKILELIEG